MADESIARVYENGGNLGKTLNIVESETSGVQILWLEEGKLGSITANGKDVGGYGWEHIKNNHMYYGKTSEHFDTVLGSNYVTEAQVKQLIYDGAKYGTQKTDEYGRLYKLYDVPGTNRQIRIGLSDNGNIISAYPVT